MFIKENPIFSFFSGEFTYLFDRGKVREQAGGAGDGKGETTLPAE